MKRTLLAYSVCFFLACTSEIPVPTLNLNYEQNIGWEKKTPCTIEIVEEGEKFIFGAKARLRGGFSSRFLKHSFTIELESDRALNGLPKNDDWILNANYIDKTMMRHKLAYDIFREMSTKNEAPRSSYVQLRMNSEYEGLYLLMEKVNAGYLGLNKKDSMAVLFKDPPVFRIEDRMVVEDSSNYFEQKFPKLKEKDHFDQLYQLRDLILHESDQQFKNDIEKWIDLENIIDWHLLILFSNNGDGILKNFFLYKKDGITPFRICPWDYDHSFGRDGDNELNLATRNADPRRNILLKRLKETDAGSYNIRLRKRWKELQASFFSEDHFIELIEKNHRLIKDETGMNFERWPIDNENYFDANTFKEEVEVLKDYFKKRIPELDEMFE